MDKRNARFWIWHADGWVKLTLKPGQTLRTWTGGDHDEGWSTESHTFSHEGDHVRDEWYHDGTDCDGRLSRGGVAMCALPRLAARCDRYTQPHRVPEWVDAGRWQRDLAAEAMGY
jgi:hypothetical protein